MFSRLEWDQVLKRLRVAMSCKRMTVRLPDYFCTKPVQSWRESGRPESDGRLLRLNAEVCCTTKVLAIFAPAVAGAFSVNAQQSRPEQHDLLDHGTNL